MAEREYCEICEKLYQQQANFILYGVTSTICASLKKNTGLTAALGHKNCEDLEDIVECLLGSMIDKIEKFSMCDWDKFMIEFMTNLKTTLDALVCSDCGQWINIEDLWTEVNKIWVEIANIKNDITNIYNLIDAIQTAINNINTRITNINNQITTINNKLVDLQDQIDDIRNNLVSQDGYFAVTKVHRITVAKEKFIDVSEAGNTIWFSGSPGQGESFITIPVTEMDLVDGIVAQPRVVGNKVHAVTVAVQSAVLSPDGNTYTVNFDTYLIEGIPGDEFPYNCPIDFIVFGRKKFIT